MVKIRSTLKQKKFFFLDNFLFFALYLVQKKSDVPSWPTYQPTMSLFSPTLLYLPTQNSDVINGRSQKSKNLSIAKKGFKQDIRNPVSAYVIMIKIDYSLVTQPMLQHWTNCMDLRSMDSYIQILCRFPKCKWKVGFSDFFLWSPFEKKNFFEGGRWRNLFAYIFGIYMKFGYLTPCDSVNVAT